MLELELPYPPSVNRMYRHTRRGIFLSDQVKRYRSLVRLMLRKQKIEPVEGDVVLEIDLYPPDRRKRDCDNAIKQIQDSIQAERHRGRITSKHHVFDDDRQVKRLVVEMRECVPGGLAVIRVFPFKKAVERVAS